MLVLRETTLTFYNLSDWKWEVSLSCCLYLNVIFEKCFVYLNTWDQRIEFITCVGIYEGMIRFIGIFRRWLVLGRPRWWKWPSRKSDRNSRLVRIYLPTSIWRDFYLSAETEVKDIFFIFRSSSSPRSAAYIMWDTGQGK